MINRDKKGGKNTRLTYRIIFLECQKIFRNPLVLLVFLTFLLINIVVVQNAYGSQDDQKSVLLSVHLQRKMLSVKLLFPMM